MKTLYTPRQITFILGCCMSAYFSCFQTSAVSINPLTHIPEDETEQVRKKTYEEAIQLLPNRRYSILARIGKVAIQPIALAGLFQGYFSCLYEIFDVKMPLAKSKELLEDMGAEIIKIPTGPNAEIFAMYFRADVFKSRLETLYQKWHRELSSLPRLQGFLEADLEAEDFMQLLRIPQASLENCSEYKKGVVRCIGANNLFEANPQAILHDLFRGMDHLAFNYRGLNESSGQPDFEGTLVDAYCATRYMLDRLNCRPEDLMIVGTSLGGAPALFTASKIHGLDVVVDRSFARLSLVKIHRLVQPFFSFFAESFFPYPNEEWITEVTGRVCIIQAKQDVLIQPFHAERLLHAYVEAKLGPNASFKEKEDLIQHSFHLAEGGHFGKLGGDPFDAWFSVESDQQKYSRFIQGKPISEE